jgi:RNA polymerase sigma factor (sigma-70 family)
MTKNKNAFPNKKFVVLSLEEEKNLLKTAKEKVEITESGDSDYLIGDIVDYQQAEKINKSLIAEQKKPLQFKKSSKRKRERIKAIRLLIHYNRHLVEYIAKSYYSSNAGVDYEDLVAEGIISLTKAIELFDLNSSSRFATYAGYWIHQKIQAFFAKSQLISQGPTIKERKNIIYYDEKKSDDKESKSYSLIDSLEDSDSLDLSNQQSRRHDITIQISNLINSLKNNKEILITRLYYQIVPKNLVDIYHLLDEPEKEILKKELKIKKNIPQLDLSEKKCQKLSPVKKYLGLFTKKYTISELARLFNQPENLVNKLKRNAFERLRNIAQEKKLYFLLE